MKYYAIQERATGRFISGTDFSRVDGKVSHIYAAASRPPLLISGDRLGHELKNRHIDLVRFEVVVVSIGVLKHENL